ncbi:MAG TPA: LD-carboxypeptidase [Candidatus Pygmaiobacter gallistercoris]|nr:LD-carboxypeptidase [Candidatus Pygmaiobacter gallistercoris]
MLHPTDHVGLVACSNPLQTSRRAEIDALCDKLKTLGLVPVVSDCIFAENGGFRTDPTARAAALMRCYADHRIRAIFDLSGGDLANEILPRLDWEQIRANPKPFFGYSDLTVLVNAIFAMTGQPAHLFQIRTLVGSSGAEQRRRFAASVLGEGEDLYSADWHFIQGTRMEGTLVGGNLRCLLKLAGTRYLPNFSDRLLFLEALHGTPPQVVTYLSQLEQMGVFDQIAGLLLGTFTQLEEQLSPAGAARLIADVIGRRDLPIAKTQQVGHGDASRCLVIGQLYRIAR